MSDYPHLGNDCPPAQLARRVDRLCDRFEAAWKAGQRPHLERYLAKSPPSVQAELLRELLVRELEYRYQSGEKPQPEEYHLRFPQHAELIDTVFSEARQATPCSLNRLHRDGEVIVLVVNNGDPVRTEKWASEVGARFPVLAQEGWTLSRRYEVFATPFAFLINEQGVICSTGIVAEPEHIGFVLSSVSGGAEGGHAQGELSIAEAGS